MPTSSVQYAARGRGAKRLCVAVMATAGGALLGRDLAGLDELLDGVHRRATSPSEGPDATRALGPGGQDATLRIASARIGHRPAPLPCRIATAVAESHMLASTLDNSVAVAAWKSALTLRMVIERSMRHRAKMETALVPSPIRMRLEGHSPRLPLPLGRLHLTIGADKPRLRRELLAAPRMEMRTRAEGVRMGRRWEHGTRDLLRTLRVRASHRHSLTFMRSTVTADPCHRLNVDSARPMVTGLAGGDRVANQAYHLPRRRLLPDPGYPVLIGAKPFLGPRRSATTTRHRPATAWQATRMNLTAAAQELVITRRVILLFGRRFRIQLLQAQGAIADRSSRSALAELARFPSGPATLKVISASARLIRGSRDRDKIVDVIAPRPGAGCQHPSPTTMVSIIALKRTKLLITPLRIKRIVARGAPTLRIGLRRSSEVYHFNLPSP